MDKFDLLIAMSGIREEYIAAAADAMQQDELRTAKELQEGIAAASVEPGAETGSGGRAGNAEITHGQPGIEAGQSGHRRPARARTLRMQRWAATAAALLCLSIVVPNVSPGAASAFRDLPFFGSYFRAVTFRSYEYQDEQADAYVEEPQIIQMASGSAQNEAVPEGAASEEAEAEAAFAEEEKSTDSAMYFGASGADAGEMPSAKTGGLQIAESMEPSMEDLEEAADAADTVCPEPQEEESARSGDVSIQAALSAAKITEEIRIMAQDKIAGFEKSITEETGYHGLRFLHETVTDTGKWFCLSVLTYTSAADGFEQLTHFTINKETGAQVELQDLFEEDSDYVTPISENIREQMRAQMAENPDIEYMIDTDEDPEFEFQEISASQDFYINEDGQLVICFDELEVAPMYMGTVEFVIPDQVAADIRRDWIKE